MLGKCIDRLTAPKMDYLAFRRYIVQTYIQKYVSPVVGGGRSKSFKELHSRVFKDIELICVFYKTAADLNISSVSLV